TSGPPPRRQRSLHGCTATNTRWATTRGPSHDRHDHRPLPVQPRGSRSHRRRARAHARPCDLDPRPPRGNIGWRMLATGRAVVIIADAWSSWFVMTTAAAVALAVELAAYTHRR